MSQHQPSLPDPDNTPGLEPGGGVSPGDTPPAGGQESGASDPQEHSTPAARGWPVAWILAIAVVAVLMVGMFVVMAVLRADAL